MRLPRTLISIALAAASAACGDGGNSSVPVTTSAPADPEVDLVSPRHDDAVMGQEGWAHAQAATADLDGDGTPERVVIIANAGSYRGRVLWNDGQIWQVYVEEPDGTRTYVYKQFLQLGSVLARLSRPESAAPGEPGEPPRILLLEQVPQRFSAYEVTYSGPAQVRSVQLVRRNYDLSSLFQGTPDP